MISNSIEIDRRFDHFDIFAEHVHHFLKEQRTELKRRSEGGIVLLEQDR